MPDTPRQSRLDEIAKRHARITPGEWFIIPDEAPGFFNVVAANIAWPIGVQIYRADAEFIAHSHEDIPYLLDQLTQADEMLKRCAGLMRESAGQVELLNSVDAQLEFTCCGHWPGHNTDCLVTKLRLATDEIERDGKREDR